MVRVINAVRDDMIAETPKRKANVNCDLLVLYDDDTKLGKQQMAASIKSSAPYTSGFGDEAAL